MMERPPVVSFSAYTGAFDTGGSPTIKQKSAIRLLWCRAGTCVLSDMNVPSPWDRR